MLAGFIPRSDTIREFNEALPKRDVGLRGLQDFIGLELRALSSSRNQMTLLHARLTMGIGAEPLHSQILLTIARPWAGRRPKPAPERQSQ
jgi:hypothetical protein